MLAIRMQRTGRKGHAQFRVVVQDSHFHPTRGRVVSYLGSYDPHTKTTILDKVKATQYLSNGAQPSDRVIGLLKKEGVKLPDWVKASDPKTGRVRNADKRRSTRPASAEPQAAPVEPAEPEPVAEDLTETPSEPAATDTPAEPQVKPEAVESDKEDSSAEEEPRPEETADPELVATPEPEAAAQEPAEPAADPKKA